MLISFFFALRAGGIPVAIQELLDLLGLLIHEELGPRSLETFYHLARASLVKDIALYDRFDRVFGAFFRGIEYVPIVLPGADIPEEWIRLQVERLFNEDELRRLRGLSLEELIRQFEDRLRRQHERHQGGTEWIATAGTSPFGSYGTHPTGIRIGGPPRTGHAVRVWDERQFADLDVNAALAGRGWRVVLRRLREFAHQGLEEVLDVDETVRRTCENGGRPEFVFQKERVTKESVILLCDRGGSMAPFARRCTELFEALEAEFKRFGAFYFHNCIYGSVVPAGAQSRDSRVNIDDLAEHWRPDTKVLLIGDASMARDELFYESGHGRSARMTGAEWLQFVRSTWPMSVWINPNTDMREWDHPTVSGIRHIFDGRMYPLTIDGVDRAVRALR